MPGNPQKFLLLPGEKGRLTRKSHVSYFKLLETWVEKSFMVIFYPFCVIIRVPKKDSQKSRLV